MGVHTALRRRKFLVVRGLTTMFARVSPMESWKYVILYSTRKGPKWEREVKMSVRGQFDGVKIL